MADRETAAPERETGAQEDNGREDLAELFDSLLEESEDAEETNDDLAAGDETAEDAETEAPEDEEPDDEDEEPEADPDDEPVAEDAEEPEAAEEPTALKDTTPVFTIRDPDGTERVITVAEARAGYMRTKDYTQKRMAEAAVAKDAAKARDEYVAVIQEYRKVLDKAYPQEPDWEKLKAENPEQYAIARVEWRELQDAKTAADAELKRQADLQEAERAKKLATFLEEEQVKLHQALPAWKTKPEVAQREATAIQGDLTARGFTPQEIAEGMVDHRMVLLARDAMRMRELEARYKKLRPRIAKPGKAPLTPGRAQDGKLTKHRKQRAADDALRRTGSVRDAAKAFEDMPELD